MVPPPAPDRPDRPPLASADAPSPEDLSDASFRTLADALPTLAWTARADGYIDWYNARWYAYTGTTPADMEGWGWQRVHDPAVLPHVLARWRASIATGAPFEMTFPLRGADGVYRDFLTRVAPVRDADADGVPGRVVRWFGTNTDLTPERAAAAERERLLGDRERLVAALGAERERLRAVILSAPAPMALHLGPAHTYALVNDAYRRISGGGDGGGRDVTGLTVRDAFPELAGQGIFEAIDGVYATGEGWGAPEVPIRYDRHGRGLEDTWYDLRLEPVRGPDGRVEGVVNFSFEVTEQVRARRAVEVLLAGSEAARAELAAAHAQLQDQQVEAELTNQQLQEQSVELEMQADELHATAAHLEERTEAAEEAAAALRRSEQRYELAARATRNAIWDWDLTTDALAWNPGVADVFGFRPEDVADTIQWWYDQIHPDDRDRVVTGIHAVIDDPLGGTAWEDEYRFRRGDGTYAQVYDRGTVAREEDGRAERMIGAMLDVTREREALAGAEAGRRAAEATTRRAAFAGAVGVAITGGGTLDDLLQRCCQAAVDHLDAAFARAWVLDSGEPVLVLRASAGRYTHLDGAHGRVPVGQFKIGQIAAERRPHLTNAVIGDPRVPEQAWARSQGMVAFAGYPLVVGEELVGVFALFARQPLDEATFGALATAATGLSVAVTNARLLEAERRAREAAEAANRSKSEFLANMSHELRTPLNAIGGYAELLELGLHGPVTDEQRHALGRVRKAQRRLLALINDILNYAKLEGGRVEYDVRAVDVADVVRDVMPFVEPQMAAKGLAFELRLPETACSVWADREKLGQVLVNLLSNATKFTDARHPVTGEPGRVRVEVTTRTEGPGPLGPDGGHPETVFVRVADTGRGIAREKQDVIFDPFVQVHAGRTRTTEGTGLGLAISRDLARGMGGDLRVRSVEGEGAVFTVTLRRVATTEGAPTDRRTRDERREAERREAERRAAEGREVEGRDPGLA